MKGSKFETVWFWVFMVPYFLIMMPLSFFYSETYIPSFGGVPSYVFGWLVLGAVTFGLIIVYSVQCLKRPEYHEFDDKE